MFLLRLIHKRYLKKNLGDSQLLKIKIYFTVFIRFFEVFVEIFVEVFPETFLQIFLY